MAVEDVYFPVASLDHWLFLISPPAVYRVIVFAALASLSTYGEKCTACACTLFSVVLTCVSSCVACIVLSSTWNTDISVASYFSGSGLVNVTVTAPLLSSGWTSLPFLSRIVISYTYTSSDIISLFSVPEFCSGSSADKACAALAAASTSAVSAASVSCFTVSSSVIFLMLKVTP